MTTRILPRKDYGRLAHTVMASSIELLPAGSRVMVIEDDGGAIVGCLGLVPLWHAEGLWIDPAHRGKGRVLRRLLQALGRTARAVGVRTVYPAVEVADDGPGKTMTAIVEGLGAQEIPVRWFRLNVEAAKPCQSL